MRVFYKPPFLQRILEADREAKRTGREIDFIALTITEFDALVLESRGHCSMEFHHSPGQPRQATVYGILVKEVK